MSFLVRSIGYVFRWYSRGQKLRDEIQQPRLLSLMATDNCNSKCVMCDIWKTKAVDELSVEEFGTFLAGELFQEIRHAGISGGEPTLRKDLPAIVERVSAALPKLETMSITSHGFHTRRWAEMLPSIIESCSSRGVRLRVNLSIDGVGETHNVIRGTKAAFRSVTSTLDVMVEAGVEVQIQSTLTSPNVFAAPRVLEWCRQRNLDVVFRQGTEIARLDNKSSLSGVVLSERESSFLADFFESRQLHEYTRSPARVLFYRDLAKRLVSGAARKAPCFFQNEGLVVSADGRLHHCSISENSLGNASSADSSGLFFSKDSEVIREKLLEDVCPDCVHDQSGAWSPPELFSVKAESQKVFRLASYMREAIPLGLCLIGGIVKERIGSEPGTREDRNTKIAVVIGAYGGEHVGDAAILGGVLLRLQERDGIEKAIVLSTRVHRTKRWVSSLRLPLEVEVRAYESGVVRDTLAEVDQLVIGGGPLMDLPRSLYQHLDAALIARKQGCSFVVEGAGIGPFKNRFSEVAARSILNVADRIVVRSKGDLASPLLEGLSATMSRDPAFDYLATRTDDLRLDFREALSLGQILKECEGKKILAVNLRPLWKKYVEGQEIDDVMDAFFKNLSSGIELLNQRMNGNLVVVSFAMNPDQYGFSDLESAQRLDAVLPAGVRHIVWEEEPGIDAVLSFLRQVDALLAMRFHACIFGLSQGTETFGIDYSVGGQGKVGKLLSEVGKSDSLIKVDELNENWIVEKLGGVLEV